MQFATINRRFTFPDDIFKNSYPASNAPFQIFAFQSALLQNFDVIQSDVALYVPWSPCLKE